MLMRQEHGGEIGIKRKAIKLIWRKVMEEKERVEKNVIMKERERKTEKHRPFFFFFEFRDKYKMY